jgi:hypothetical protein
MSRERGQFNKLRNQPPRCSQCGKPNPICDEGYTLCCNQTLVYPDEGKDYRLVKEEWESDADDYRQDR